MLKVKKKKSIQNIRRRGRRWVRLEPQCEAGGWQEAAEESLIHPSSTVRGPRSWRTGTSLGCSLKSPATAKGRPGPPRLAQERQSRNPPLTCAGSPSAAAGRAASLSLPVTSRRAALNTQTDSGRRTQRRGVGPRLACPSVGRAPGDDSAPPPEAALIGPGRAAVPPG